MTIPVLLLILLIGGALLAEILRQRAARTVYPAATATAVAAGLLWLLYRSQIPQATRLLPWSASGILPDLTWQFDEVSWSVTAWLLLLLIGVLLGTFRAERPRLVFAVMILTAVTLAAIWSGSPTTTLVGWTLLLLTWSGIVWLVGGVPPNPRRFILKVSLLATAVLFLWLAVAAAPAAGSGFQVHDWTEVGLIAGMIAVLLQMGIWPLSVWRPAVVSLPSAAGIMIILAPVVSGAVLLVRLAEANLPIGTAGLLITLAALFGVLRALQSVWSRAHLPAAAALYLVVIQTHLLLLTAVWGGVDGALSLLRLLILTTGILFLSKTGKPSRQTWWTAVAPVIAMAALAGLPLTAGLVGQASLYGGLLVGGRPLLLLVMILLQIPMLTAALQLFFDKRQAPEIERTPLLVLREAGAILLGIGLISLSTAALDGVSPWLGVIPLFNLAASLVLYRYVREFRRTAAAVRHAFRLHLPFRERFDSARNLFSGVGGTLVETAAILEGDGNLLWLLILIVLFILFR